ncbi:MAG: hypothetical protein ACREQC_16000, partial [Candidatus Binataceae bacterium]
VTVAAGSLLAAPGFGPALMEGCGDAALLPGLAVGRSSGGICSSETSANRSGGAAERVTDAAVIAAGAADAILGR